MTEQKLKFVEINESEQKWVQPFEGNPFRMNMRRVGEVETNRVFDKHKVYPGSAKNTMVRLSRVSDDLMVASVLEWEHPEEVGLLDESGNPAPCDDKNKRRLDKIIVSFEKDGESVSKSLYSVAVEKFNSSFEEETKN